MAILLLLLQSCVTPTTAQNDFVKIAAGEYILGATNHILNPKHTVQVNGFEIAIHEVTNTQFAAFVEATGYMTSAEKHHNALVFYPGLAEFRWHLDTTASWRFPNGVAQGGIEAKMDHPVTCISHLDARAYCKWAGVRLPTLDEWEIAARAGKRSRYYWGNDPSTLGNHSNIWHGKDHLVLDTGNVGGPDKWSYTAPVGSFSPNPYGLYDIYGNVFEFCADKPTALVEQAQIGCARGGSWWCSLNSCSFFNSIDIGRVNLQASFSNQGFRVAK